MWGIRKLFHFHRILFTMVPLILVSCFHIWGEMEDVVRFCSLLYLLLYFKTLYCGYCANSENTQLLSSFTIRAQPLQLGSCVLDFFFFFNPFSAALRLPMEGGDEEQNTHYNSFINIMPLNSDISRAWVRNEGERPGWRTTGLGLTGSSGHIQHDTTSQAHLNFLLMLCFLLLFFN